MENQLVEKVQEQGGVCHDSLTTQVNIRQLLGMLITYFNNNGLGFKDRQRRRQKIEFNGQITCNVTSANMHGYHEQHNMNVYSNRPLAIHLGDTVNYRWLYTIPEILSLIRPSSS